MIRRVLTWLGYGLNRTTGPQNPDPGSYNEASPAPVSFDTAMQLSAVWACSRLLAEAVAGLPVIFTRTSTDNKESPYTGDVAQVFSGKVNRYQTRFEFMETMMLNLVMRGNCYALKQRSGNRLVGLLPIMSEQVETKLLADGSVVHYYYHDRGVTALSEDSVWHCKLFGNGIIGLSPLGYARNTIGIALAGESRVSKIFQNGGKPTGVLMIDKILNETQRDQIRTEFNALREGSGDRLMVLEASMKYQAVSMSPQDIQLLESRRFQIEDLCRFMGVPSVLVNDTQGSTVWGSGIEQIVQGFYKLNLRPYLERFEASIIQNLLPAADKLRVSVEFDFDALLRADMRARYEALQKALNAGLMTPNEARHSEGLAPMEGGDLLYVNSTMIPLLSATGRTKNKGKIHDRQKKLEDLMLQLKNWSDEKPVINVDARTTVTQAPTSITMPEIKSPDIHVEVKPTTINVPAPIINMEAKETNITIPPSIINVEAPKHPDRMKMDIVSMPARETTSSISRDTQGNIVSTSQTEKDKPKK